MTVKIILSVFNRPDFLPIQIKLIKKFLQNEHKIVVVHDSRNNEYVDEFEKICESLDVKFHHHESLSGKNVSVYHGESIQWAYDNIISKECIDDLTVILDHDMFLIEELDIVDFFGENDVAGRHQNRGEVEYIWPGIMMLKYNKIKHINFNFYPGRYFGELLDTGGGTCHILKTEGIKYKETSCEYPETYDDINLLDQSINLGFGFELHLNNKFLHFRNACGWHNNMEKDPNDENKKKVLEYILKDII